MKEDKSLQEIHAVMEKIYDDDIGLTREQKTKKINEEADKFLTQRNLNLKKVKSGN
jgi:hypothetical protein